MNRLSEVVFPVSRAVVDDSDEEDQPVDPSPIFRWKKPVLNEKGQVECQCLIIAVGPVSTGFMDSLFHGEERETLGSVCCGGRGIQGRTWSQTAPTDESCFIWRCKNRPEVVVCECRESVSSQQSFSWVEQLFATLKPSTVAILDTQSIGELKTGSELLGRGDYYPLLALRSSRLTAKPCCPFLEPPNTVGGLGAEVLTHCEVYRQPALLYVAYISDREPLPLLTDRFRPVLSCSTLQPHLKGRSPNLSAVNQNQSLLRDTGLMYI